MSDQGIKGRLIFTFDGGTTMYGVFARYIKEILALPDLTGVPGDCDVLKGLFSYKGSILPVLSFSKLCHDNDADKETVCLVLQEDGGAMVGLSIAGSGNLITESAGRLAYEQDEMNKGWLKIDAIIPGTEPIMIIDIAGTLQSCSSTGGTNP